MKDLLDIKDRGADLKDLHKRLTTLEIGIRAVTVMYDEHSKDKDSKDNIFRLKENFCYRLTGAKHQYLLLLREIGQSEANLTHLAKYQPNQLTGFYPSNPHFDQIEEMLSSIFDSCIFQITSAFDYLSHMISYILLPDNKKASTYWTQFMKQARDKNNPVFSFETAKTLHNADKDFVCELNNYRSRLIHNSRDRHTFNATQSASDVFNVQVITSDYAIKHFKSWKNEVDKQYTLQYVISHLIRMACDQTDLILNSIITDIKANSNYEFNLNNAKKPGAFHLLTYDAKTGTAIPVSDTMWEEYLTAKQN